MTTAQSPAAVIHIPHASTLIPEEVRGQFVLSDAELGAEIRLMTDHLTDELFAMPREIATTIRFPVSRLVVDPERFESDGQEPMGYDLDWTACRPYAGLRDDLKRLKGVGADWVYHFPDSGSSS